MMFVLRALVMPLFPQFLRDLLYLIISVNVHKFYFENATRVFPFFYNDFVAFLVRLTSA